MDPRDTRRDVARGTGTRRRETTMGSRSGAMRTSRSLIGALSLTLALVVASCAAQQPAAQTPAAAVATAAAAPQRGGTMVIPYEFDPSTLMPITGKASYASTFSPLFNRLLWLDSEFKPTPDLAESWDVSPDGLTYTFKLNAKAKWHDGKPVTAADVEFTFNELFAKRSPTRSVWWNKVASAKATDERTFVFTLKEPFAPLPTYLAHPLGYAEIYAKHNLEGKDVTKLSTSEEAMGTGPFKLKEWVKGTSMTFVRNEDYFKPGKPYLDSLVFRFLPDAASRSLAFEKGEIDYIIPYLVPLENVERYRADQRFAVINGGLGVAAVGFLLMNVDHPVLSKKAVRQAIAHAIDRGAINKLAMSGQSKVATSVLSSQIKPYYNGKYDVYSFDAAKAGKMLDDAGYKKGADGYRFKVRLANRIGRDHEAKAVEIMKSNLTAVGIDVTVEMLESSVYTPKVMLQRNFDLVLQLLTTGPDPLQGVDFLFDSKNIGVNNANAMGYKNAAVDALFAETTRVSGQKRIDLYDQAQKLIMDDLPALPLYEYPNIALASAKVRDINLGAADYVSGKENAYIVGGK